MAYVAEQRGWTQTQYLADIGVMLDRTLRREA